MPRIVILLGISCVACLAGPARGEGGPFDGPWRTSIGSVKIKQDGDSVTGTYGDADQFTLKGKVEGKSLAFEYSEGESRGDARWTLDDTGFAFDGRFQVRNGRAGLWNGWKPDPEASRGPRADFGGLWLTTSGLMELKHDGNRVVGRYAARGTSDVEGTVTGRRLDYRFQGFRGGEGWFDRSVDGKALAGAAHGDGFAAWFGWDGRKAPEFARHARLKAGEIVDGSTEGLLTYSVRAPEGYVDGGATRYPTVLILHGSNMNGRAYVNTIASTWPDLAREFILLGINGEYPSATGDDPRFTYTYANFMGKSTYKGFPGTDRESPALVSEAMAELRGVYPIARYYVGGHSQGGFLTYLILMNDPGSIAGAFPISAGLAIQCDPAVFDDAALKAAQRRVPLAIIHGQGDPVVDYGAAKYAVDLFGQSDWPAFRLFAPAQGGHMFALLPVDSAIRWLDALASDDPARLLDFAHRRLAEGGYRDAVAALNRARDQKPASTFEARLASLSAAIETKAAPPVSAYLAKIRGDAPGWIDGFLAYRDDFQFADAARPSMTEFDALRTRHEGPARQAYHDARGLFQQGKADAGYAKYREIVDKYPASTLYRLAKRSLAERP